MHYKKRIIIIFLSIIIIIGCDKNDKIEDPQGINYEIEENINAVVVDTQLGWTLLSEDYGFLELIEPLHDSLHIDGMKLRIKINRGKAFEKRKWYRFFTYASLNFAIENPTLYDNPPAIIEIFWSPDDSDEIIKYPDGYGYDILVSSNSIKIRQSGFPGVPGFGTFKTEVEAFKMGVLVTHLLISNNGLPTTNVSDLDFLKIDWY